MDEPKNYMSNRTIRINKELTSFHKEVISNLQCIHGALLCMNRSVQAVGTFGIIKWDRNYKRLFRRGKESVLIELTLISCGYNLYKWKNLNIQQKNYDGTLRYRRSFSLWMFFYSSYNYRILFPVIYFMKVLLV